MDCDNSSVSSAAVSLTSNDDEDAANTNDGSSTPNDSVSKGKSAREVVAPLAHMSYSDQLEHKKNSLLHVLKKLVRSFTLYKFAFIFEFIYNSLSIIFLDDPIYTDRLGTHEKPVHTVFLFLNGC